MKSGKIIRFAKRLKRFKLKEKQLFKELEKNNKKEEIEKEIFRVQELKIAQEKMLIRYVNGTLESWQKVKTKLVERQKNRA